MSKVTQIRQKARNYLQKGKYDKAIEEYKRLTGMETKNPNHLNELGDIYIKAGDNVQAVSSFEKAVVNYEKVALYNNAVAVCKKILRIVPGRTDTIYKMGELRAKQKLEGEARSYFSQYLDSILADAESYGPELNERILILLELVPECDEIIAKAAAVFKLIGLKTGAFELYCKLVADAERNGETEKHQEYLREAEGLKSSMTKEEIKGVEDSIARSTAAPTAGECEEPASEVREDDAEADMEETPAEEPAVEEPVAESGSEAAEEVDADDEEADAADADGRRSEAAYDEPDLPAAQTEPGSDEEKAREYEMPLEDDIESHAGMESPDAEEAAAGVEPPAAEQTQSAEEAPETAHAGSAEGETSVGSVASAVESALDEALSADDGTGEKAAEDETAEEPAGFDDIIENEPSSAEAENLVEEITSDVEEDDYRSHYDLGMAYLEMALYTEAIKEFQIASRSDQLQVKSIEMIGHCFLQQDNPRLAVKQLKRGLEITNIADSENLGVHYNLGLAYELLGEHEKAREHFEEVYIVDISFRDVAEKMKKFSSVS